MAIDLRKPTKPAPATTKQSITPVLVGLAVIVIIFVFVALTSFDCVNYAK